MLNSIDFSPTVGRSLVLGVGSRETSITYIILTPRQLKNPGSITNLQILTSINIQNKFIIYKSNQSRIDIICFISLSPIMNLFQIFENIFGHKLEYYNFFKFLNSCNEYVSSI